MATYGLKTWGSGGNLTLDLTDSITRLRYSIETSSTGSTVLSDISGKSTVQFAMPLGNGVPQVVSRSGTTISWLAAPSGGATCLILVFIYD